MKIILVATKLFKSQFFLRTVLSLILFLIKREFKKISFRATILIAQLHKLLDTISKKIYIFTKQIF